MSLEVMYKPFLNLTNNGGLLLSGQYGPDGNMAGYTAQILQLMRFKVLSDEEKALYTAFTLGLETLRVGNYFSRVPTAMQDTSIDDYLSLAAIYPGNLLDVESLVYTLFPWKALGITGVFKQWMGRFMGFYPHLKYCAAELPYPLDRLSWALSILWAAHQPVSSQDSWMQSHLMVMAYSVSGCRTKLCDLAASYWWKKKPASMHDIVASYLDLGQAPHPLVDYWGEFGKCNA